MISLSFHSELQRVALLPATSHAGNDSGYFTVELLPAMFKLPSGKTFSDVYGTKFKVGYLFKD